jgi:uncharacterized membrane protein YtjA (UPF0391 family)
VPGSARHRLPLFSFVVQSGCSTLRKEYTMLYYAGVFFIIAIIAAVFGFGGIAASAAGIAKILFYIFLVVALVSLVMSLLRR